MLPTEPLRLVGPAEKLLSKPSWSDPTFLMLTTEWDFREIVCNPGVVNTLAVPDPKRWGIGFVVGLTGLGTCQIGPFSDPNEWFFLSVTGPNATIFTIFQYGPIVCGQWYGFPPAASTVRVYELSIQG